MSPQGDLSKRRACGLLGIARSGLSYALRLPGKDAPVLDAMRRLSSKYPRYGYRRIRIFLKREGLAMSEMARTAAMGSNRQTAF